MPFDKDEGIPSKAGVKTLLEALCCFCIKPLAGVGKSMINPGLIQIFSI